jgi:hypothetical protein
VVIDGLKRRELQPYKKQQNGENERHEGDHGSGRQRASDGGCYWHGRPTALCRPFHARLLPRSLSAFSLNDARMWQMFDDVLTR